MDEKDVREKLVELLDAIQQKGRIYTPSQMDDRHVYAKEVPNTKVADHLIAHGVTVQEHEYWETVVDIRSNTVCGDGAKIEYKRCSCCKNPVKFLEDNFCGNCGAKLDLSQPSQGDLK